MKSNKKPWPLRSTHGIRERINTNPDFQRPPVWSRAQKQLLVDTILRDYDIPKLYWRKVSTKPDKYDVVDGQQRLRAIWGFFDGDFPLPKDAQPIDSEAVANLRYDQLPDDLRMRFDVYALDVVVLEDSDEDEVREMFLRLQNGTSLKAQEKRNAYPGQMRDFVHQLASHPVFQAVGFANARFNHDLVAAQLLCLELAGGPTNIKNADLNRMYSDYAKFDSKSTEAKAVQRTLNILAETFPEKTPELERFNLISLYCVVAEMQKQYAFDQVKPILQDWFFGFEAARRAQEQKPDDEVDPEWSSYKEKISHSTDAADSVRWRMDFMLRHLLEAFPAIQRKDNRGPLPISSVSPSFAATTDSASSSSNATARNSPGTTGTATIPLPGRAAEKPPLKTGVRPAPPAILPRGRRSFPPSAFARLNKPDPQVWLRAVSPLRPPSGGCSSGKSPDARSG